MRYSFGVLVLFTMAIFAVPLSAAGDYLYIKDITMRLEDSNAIFEINYTLETFTNLYVLALGCKYIEPDLKSLFGNYRQVQVIRAGPGSAALIATGAGKYNSGYYLFDSKPFGSMNKPLREKIAQFRVVYPGGRYRSFYNVTSTQNVFCEAKNLKKTSNLSLMSNNTTSKSEDQKNKLASL